MAKKKKAAGLSFEEAIKRLEEVVTELEQSTVTLEVSLALFTEGIELVQLCQAILNRAEERISVLIEKPDGTLVTEEMDE